MATKRVVLIPDGMADVPLEKLGGVTPLEYAKTPVMDALASRGIVGLTHNVPDGMEPGSDVAIMSIMGYDPKTCYTGRGPIEAISMGVDIAPGELGFRCNLINTDGDILIDYSAGHISTEEGAELIAALHKELGADDVRFSKGVSFRHVLVLKTDHPTPKTYPPHDHMDEKWEQFLPAVSPCAKRLSELILASRDVLKDHPVNKARIAAGKKPATMIWPWSGGTTPKMESFEKMFGMTGAAISAVDLVQGLAMGCGMKVIKVPGATGMVDTNYEGKAQAAIDALDEVDLVVVHVEGTDEAAHMGDLDMKLLGIENFDSRIAAPIIDALEKRGDYRILLMPDHPTPITIRTHVSDPVPFIAVTSNKNHAGPSAFTEKTAADTGIVNPNGFELMKFFTSDSIFETK